MKILYKKHYNNKLNSIACPPTKLYYSGDINLLDKKIVTIVGTRNPTEYGIAKTKQIVEKLLKNDIVVASGFAMGIDTVVHSKAQSLNKKNIAVLGTGLDINYPMRNNKLKQEMINSNSLFITEYPLGVKAKPYHFPRRNRILSAICDILIVIECKIKSGTMITAKYAIEQHKEIWVLPGNIDSPYSEGTNYLIFQGANPLYSLELI